MDVFEIYAINKYNPINNKESNRKCGLGYIYIDDSTFIRKQFKRDGFIETKLTSKELEKSIDDLLVNLSKKKIIFHSIKKNRHSKVLFDEKYIKDNSEVVRKDITNTLKRKFKSCSSKDVSMNFIHSNLRNLVLTKETDLDMDEYKDKKYHIHVGIFKIHNKSLEYNMLYNAFILLNNLMNIKSDVIEVLIHDPSLNKIIVEKIIN